MKWKIYSFRNRKWNTRILFFIVKIFNIHMYILYENGERIILIKAYQKGTYCETHKTVNTKNIYGMLLCCEK